MEGLSDEDKYPLLGSAFYCKSRQEYELEAKQGPSGTSLTRVLAHLRVHMCACVIKSEGVCAGYFFCQDYVDYAAA